MLTGTWAAVTTFILGAIALAALVAASAAVILAQVKGIETTAWSTGSGVLHSAESFGTVLLAGIGYATVGAVLGSLLRSPVMAIVVGAARMLPNESILNATVNGSGRWPPGQLLPAVASQGRAA